MDNLTKVGSTVIYTDGYRCDHQALVTAVWGPDCINVVYVTGDESKTDTYGRQIERQTSVWSAGQHVRPRSARLAADNNR
jgi:hypothetical protein